MPRTSTYRVTIDTSRLSEADGTWQRYCEDERGTAADRARMVGLGSRDGDDDVWTVRGRDAHSVLRCVRRLTKGHDVSVASVEAT